MNNPGVRYQPEYYSQSVTIKRKPEVLYRRKRWVPLWLWRLVAEVDILSLVESKLDRQREPWVQALTERDADMETDISS